MTIEEAVQSWLEEQTDMAHILSQNLGVLVKTCSIRKDHAFKARLKAEGQQLLKDDTLEFKLQVKGAASEVEVVANFRKETVMMSMRLTPPQDKGNRARVTWIEKQIERCAKNDPEVLDSIKEGLFIDTQVKYKPQLSAGQRIRIIHHYGCH